MKLQKQIKNVNSFILQLYVYYFKCYIYKCDDIYYLDFKFKLFLWYIPYYNCFLIDFSIYELIDHINDYFILIISNLIVILLLVNPYPITFVILSLLH